MTNNKITKRRANKLNTGDVVRLPAYTGAPRNEARVLMVETVSDKIEITVGFFGAVYPAASTYRLKAGAFVETFQF